MSTLFLFVGILICSLLLHAFFLWVGAKLAKIQQVSYRRALGTFCVVALIQFLMQMAFLVFGRTIPPDIAAWRFIGIWLTETVVVVLVAWLIIRGMFRTTVVKAILAWLPTLVGAAIMLAFVFLIIKPFVMEAFVVSNNSMAPTLLGPHYVANCSQCGHPCAFDASRLPVPGTKCRAYAPIVLKACRV